MHTQNMFLFHAFNLDQITIFLPEIEFKFISNPFSALQKKIKSDTTQG